MGEAITYKSVVLRLERRRGLLSVKGGKKNKKKQEREKKLSHIFPSFLLVPRKRRQKSTLSTYNIRARYLLQLARSLLHTHRHVCYKSLSLSLSRARATAENQHYYHHYHHRSIEEHEGGSDVFFPKHTLMCPPCSNILKNTAWKPKECAASTPLTLSW